LEKDVIIKKQQKKILEYIKENGKITSRQAEELLEVKQRRARIVLVEMVNNGLLEKQGAYKTPVYVINNK
jgi:ATP-dependent DNA helicase RecG